MGEEEASLTATRRRDEVISVLAERVEVKTVEERFDRIVLITIRLPDGTTEQAQLATQEWVQLQLIALEEAHGLVYVPRYV